MRTPILVLASLAATSLMAQADTDPAPVVTTAPVLAGPTGTAPAAAPTPTPAPATTPAAPAVESVTAPVPVATAPTVVPAAAVAAPTIVVAATTPADAAGSGSTKNKDTLSVDFPDEEIRTVLRNVSDLFELNLVIPDTLQGRTSIKLREVTWRQIFQVVLSPIGYSFVEDGNIIKIVSRDALEAEPFITDTVVLENVAAAGIQPLLTSILTPGKAATTTVPAAVGGSIVLNALANELIITDQAGVVRRIREMARRLDAEPKQVVIETKFIEITKTEGSKFQLGVAGQAFRTKFNTFGTALPATLGTSGTFNAVLNADDFSVLLTALDSLGDTRLVSSPTIVAINGSKSEIKIGLDKQLINATQNTASSGSNISTTYTAGGIQFAGVKIEVTPQITSSKLVSLKVKTEKSELVASFTDPNSGQQFFDINKREGDLSIILRDGQTAAIGGLMDTNDTKNSTKVPVLGNIPVLGNLFKSRDNNKTDRNLIVFITANILEPSKMSYTNLASRDQINSLKVTERDIKGVSYKPTDEETRLYDASEQMRKKIQDDALANRLKAEAAPPPVKK